MHLSQPLPLLNPGYPGELLASPFVLFLVAFCLLGPVHYDKARIDYMVYSVYSVRFLFGSILIRFNLFYLGPVRYDKARIDYMVLLLVARCASNCLANYPNFSTFGGQYSEGI